MGREIFYCMNCGTSIPLGSKNMACPECHTVFDTVRYTLEYHPGCLYRESIAVTAYIPFESKD